MRAARFVLVATMASVIIQLGGAARASGMDTWAIEGQPGELKTILVQGERVRATTMVDLEIVKARNKDDPYRAGPDQGPFYAYVTRRVPAPGLEPVVPPLPSDAVMVAEVQFTQTSRPRLVAAWIEFDVPALEPGHYVLHACNSPCTRQIGYTGSKPITIVEDDGQAFLAAELENHDLRLGRFAWVGHRLDKLRQITLDQEAQIKRLEEELAATKQGGSVTPNAARRGSTAPWTIAGLTLIALLLVLAWRQMEVRPGQPVLR